MKSKEVKKGLYAPPRGIGDATRARAIGLYGPTSQIKYAPYNNRNNVISRFDSDKNVQNIPSRRVIKRLEGVVQT
ncbi:hypothetical protein HYT56_02240 [Candidatus Woesearchaeota archaeon]|nr:hypothetical protein [Candidatus Woesearchaeota archaeon]